MSVEARIKELGIELPEAPQYLGNYIGAKWAGNIAISCGQGPFSTTISAPVGEGITVEEERTLDHDPPSRSARSARPTSTPVICRR